MSIKHPPIETVDPTVMINRTYTEEELEQEDKSLFALCSTCLNWLKQTEL